MKTPSTISLFLLSLLFAQTLADGCFIDAPHIQDVIKTPLTVLSSDELPKEWLWNNVNGTNFLTLIRNQHIPQYCGSCWAFAATSVLSDRIKIMRKASWPDYEISPQVIISCDHESKGCKGGSAATAYKYIHEFNVSHETCSNYQARGWTNGLDCSNELKCLTCDHSGKCNVPEEYPIYGVSEYGKVSGELAIMNELYQRGPVACSMFSSPIHNYTGGIINLPDQNNTNHVVSIVGYGEENGVKYWRVRNSWGTYWGEDGFFRIIRGTNNLRIEQNCHWAVPTDTWTNSVRNHSKSGTVKTGPAEATSKAPNHLRVPTDFEGCVSQDYFDLPKLTSISGTIPGSEIMTSALEKAWDWRNVSGRNYLSWIKNQHIPVYCGSCWAQAATSTLADAINIKRGGTYDNVALSVQAILNCKAGGSCHGGSSYKVFQYAHEHGIPEESCQIYESRDPKKAECSNIQVCKNCAGPSPAPGEDGQERCWAVENFRLWKVSDYGTVSGVENMKKTIKANGPIACGIKVTQKLVDYNRGIFTAKDGKVLGGHLISVVGWGVENDVEYWIVRNSWGTYWGEQGFIRMKTGESILGIEEHCSWAVPIIDEKENTKTTAFNDFFLFDRV